MIELNMLMGSDGVGGNIGLTCNELGALVPLYRVLTEVVCSSDRQDLTFIMNKKSSFFIFE